MSGLSAKHRELKRRRAEVVAKMGALVKKEDDADAPLSDDESTTFDELAAALAAIDQRLQRVAAAMQAAAEGATDANGGEDNEDDDEGDKGLGGQRGSFRVRTDRTSARPKRTRTPD